MILRTNFWASLCPSAGGMNDMQAQRIIGDLTQTLMRKLPAESRRGYMLQAKQFFDWQRFTEVLWGIRRRHARDVASPA